MKRVLAMAMCVMFAASSVVLAGTTATECELQSYYGEKLINSSLASIISGLNTTVVNDGSPCGIKNFKMINLMNSSINTTPCSKSTANMMAGTQAGAVSDLAVRGSSDFGYAMGGANGRTSTLVKQGNNANMPAASGNALGSLGMSDDPMNRVWASTYGQWESAKNDGGISGYDYNTWGVILGYDRFINSCFAVGASASFSRGTFKDDDAFGHDSHINSGAFGLYGVYSPGNGMFATLYGGYTIADNDIKERRYGTSTGGNVVGYYWDKADYNSHTWNVGATFGHNFSINDRFAVTPSIGLQYVNTRNEDHNYYFDGRVFSRIRDVDNWALYLPVELNTEFQVMATDCSSLLLTTHASYTYNFNDDSAGGLIQYNGLIPNPPTGDFVTARAASRKVGRHTVRAGIGMEYRYKNLDFGVKYDYYHQSKWRAHRIAGTVGLSF